MDSANVTPINHTPGSEFAAKATGTVGGAVKGGLTAALVWTAAAALLGVGIGLAITTGGVGGLALGSISNVLFSWPVGLGLVGAVAGAYTSWIPGGVGAVLGGLKGHSKASERVSNERAAAVELQTAIATQQAQSLPSDSKYNFPPQGSSMNPAGAKISAMEYEGLAAGQQLQRA